jgi:hypothetical protein
VVERADLTTPTWTGPGPGSSSPFGEGLVTADVVAAFFAVDVSCVYRMAGKSLPVVLIGRAKRFRVRDVLAFVEQATRGGSAGQRGQSAPVDRVQQLVRGASRGARPARSNDLDVSAGQSVHRAQKQEPWRPPGPKPEDN